MYYNYVFYSTLSYDKSAESLFYIQETTRIIKCVMYYNSKRNPVYGRVCEFATYANIADSYYFNYTFTAAYRI